VPENKDFAAHHGTDNIAWCNADTNLAGYWQTIATFA